jgi:CMP-N,N'-diacetyllegionaminic acid synthase
MNLTDISILAVVPARGGSKSIPRKNLCEINGVSLVGKAASIVNSIQWINAAVISTDDEEIAAEGIKYGLSAPFRRPTEISGDTATSVDMWKHAWTESEIFYGTRFEISVLLEPTSPLRTVDDVEKTVLKLLRGNHSSAATVSLTPAHFTPQKTLTVENDIIDFYHAMGSQYSLRQTIPKYYHRNGLCYAVTRDHLFNKNRIIDNETAAVVVERNVVNIDEPFELELAEWLLKRNQAL